MARIVVGSYCVPYPVGGYLSWILQWVLGFHRLGHDVYYAEKSWSDQYFDPAAGTYGPDPQGGIRALSEMLDRFGLAGRWCFVDDRGRHHGLSEAAARTVLSTADLFVDMGAHGQWEDQIDGLHVLVDGEPCYNQIRMIQRLAAGERLPEYDAYYSVGQNIGAPDCKIPTVGREWRRVVDPVCPELFPITETPADAAFTTVMSWQAHEPITHEGTTYGQKDVEFSRFITLPQRTSCRLEIAVGGKRVPRESLSSAGWTVAESHQLSSTLDDFWRYLLRSRGEFSVCKNVFVASRSGFFSERSAAYLACGRPVVLQDSGWSAYFPTGRGLFAVEDVEQAAAAIDAVMTAPERHSKWAREVAEEHFGVDVVLARFLSELGVV